MNGRQKDDKDQGQKPEEHKEDDQKSHNAGPTAPFAIGGQGVGKISEQEGDRNGKRIRDQAKRTPPKRTIPVMTSSILQVLFGFTAFILKLSFLSRPLNPLLFQTLPDSARLI